MFFTDSGDIKVDPFEFYFSEYVQSNWSFQHHEILGASGVKLHHDLQETNMSLANHGDHVRSRMQRINALRVLLCVEVCAVSFFDTKS